MPTCGRCGEDNPARARFCLRCGTALDQGPGRELRKTVTVVFTDIAGSTSLGEKLDPEPLRHVVSRFFEAMREVLERHGGRVEKFIGDAVVAVFGVPELHEDDALRAVRAADEMRRSLEHLNRGLEQEWGVRLRSKTGLNTGEVVAGDGGTGQSLVLGDAVNIAARLEQAAEPGEILIGADTYPLVRDAVRVERLEPIRLRGKESAVETFRLLEVMPGRPGFQRRMDSPMVGRHRERILLDQAFQRSREDGTSHLFTILGAAGVGKSRLARELVTGCGDTATVLGGRCLPYGEGITFAPITQVIHEAAGLGEDDDAEVSRRKLHALVEGEDDGPLVLERIAQLLGLGGGSGSSEEVVWAVRRLLEILARRTPVVVVLDDIHWAEPTLLDLIEYVADWSRHAVIFIVCLARPELLDLRPQWAGGKLNATSILLEPLNREESGTLIRNLLGSEELDEQVSARVTASSEGNPLFVEEMVAMLIDHDLLRIRDGRWVPTGDLSVIAIPATIQALLEARLDRLGPEERSVIERASVEGKVFHMGTVVALGDDDASAVGAHLQTLVRKELITPSRPELAGEETFSFRHIMIRDAAYRGMPKETRAELHARFAEWMAAAAGSRIAEYEEILGYHLEQAYRYRAELGPVDEEATRLAREGSEHLHATGRRAHDRGDLSAAVNLMGRAMALAGPRPPVGLLADLGEALNQRGDFKRAEETLAVAVDRAHQEGDRAGEWLARMSAAMVRLNVDPGDNTVEDVRREAEEAVTVFEELDSEIGLARAWHVLAHVHWVEARAAAVEEALENAVRYARRGADRQQEVEDLALMAMVASWGPRPSDQAIRRCEEVLDRAGGHRKVEGFTLAARAAMEAARGRFDVARDQSRRAREIMAELGNRVLSAGFTHGAGTIELLAGDPEAAEEVLMQGYRALDRMGERAYLSTSAALVAEALYRQGRYEEAERFTRISEDNADVQDLASQIQWRFVRAKVRSRTGDLEEAERLARDAVTLAEETDFLDTRGDSLLALGEVLERMGRDEDARRAIEAATDLYRRKGATVLVAQASGRMEALAG